MKPDFLTQTSGIEIDESKIDIACLDFSTSQLVPTTLEL